MSTFAFIARFRELHAQAKKGGLALSPDQRAEYEEARLELGRTMMLAQQMTRGGKTLRSTLRVAQLIKVDLDLGTGAPERTSTIDLASGGFAVLLSRGLPVGGPLQFTLFLPASGSGAKLVSGLGKVASSRAHGTLHRVSVAFDAIDGNGLEHLEIVIVDAILARFQEQP